MTEEEKSLCIERIYKPFHEAIVNELRAQENPAYVVSWDNTAHYTIGNNEAGEPQMMPPFILSNRGREESAESNGLEETSCDPVFMLLLVDALKIELERHSLPSEIHLNLVYKGGYICQQYNTRRHQKLRDRGITIPVQSLQVEYDTNLTHDQETLEFYPERAALLSQAFSDALAEAYHKYSEISKS